MFYGYNPVYLITFLFVWFYSLEEHSEKLAQSYWNTLEYPIASAAADQLYLPISQNIDWP